MSELIIKHLDERFIVNLGVSYNDHLQRRERSDDEIIEGLTLHSYNDRLIEKQNDRHIQNSILILIDFVRTCKKFHFWNCKPITNKVLYHINRKINIISPH